MNEAKVRDLLARVATCEVSAEQAYQRLRHLPFEDLGFARIDNHRAIRRGVPEVIFGDGKSAAQIALIGRRMIAGGSDLIVTRLSAEKARELKRKLPQLDYHSDARLGLVLTEAPRPRGHGLVAVISAGTSDIPVAEEAALCAEAFGNRVARLNDVGVAGLHRLLAETALLEEAAVLIVVAGMEGALPSVVAGLVNKPVIAVPTSIGYGVALGGLTALFGMLNSCAGGLTVVNIDNGF